MGLLIFHSVYSIGLPIFLFGVAFPELKSKSLVSGFGVKFVFLALTVDCVLLYIFVSVHYSGSSPGVGLLLSGGLAIALLVNLASNLPGHFTRAIIWQA